MLQDLLHARHSAASSEQGEPSDVIREAKRYGAPSLCRSFELAEKAELRPVFSDRPVELYRRFQYYTPSRLFRKAVTLIYDAISNFSAKLMIIACGFSFNT